MTRINVGIPPKQLTQRHLLAEHREIKRIPNAINNKKAIIKNIPPTFRLGTGHVKFFYDKQGYLLKRYKQIHQECIKRNYNVQNYESAWDGIPKHLMNDYQPTTKDIQLIQDRINSKLSL